MHRERPAICEGIQAQTGAPICLGATQATGAYFEAKVAMPTVFVEAIADRPHEDERAFAILKD